MEVQTMNPQSAADAPRFLEVGPFQLYYLYDDLFVYMPSGRSHRIGTVGRNEPATGHPLMDRRTGADRRQEEEELQQQDNHEEEEESDEEDPYEGLPDLMDRSGNVIHFYSNPQCGEILDSLVGTTQT